MPRYFFDTYSDARECVDEVGLDLQDRGHAQVSALELLPHLGHETLGINETRSFIVRVVNHEERYLLLVSLGLKCMEMPSQDPG